MSNPIQNNLDELIKHERRIAAERIAKHKRAAAAKQRRIDATVIELLQENEPDLYDRLAREATDALTAEKSKRSSRAKKALKTSSDLLVASTGQTPEQETEEEAPWNR